jgi:hypothetical protein
MPRVGVVQLSNKDPQRAGAICAFLSWFVSVTGLYRLPEWPGCKVFTRGNAGGPAGTSPTIRQSCPLIPQIGRWHPFGPPSVVSG